VNSWRLLHGDVRERLRDLPYGSVQTCVTSPPYWGLRDYGVSGQIGLEQTPEAFVAALVLVFAEVRRVLADDGTVWLNLGDSYAGSNASQGGDGTAAVYVDGRGSIAGAIARQAQRTAQQTAMKRGDGLKPKDLCGIPWRVAFALQQPHYNGSISRLEDRVWLAAMLDAEGCMFIHKRKAGQSNGQGYYRQNDNFGPGVEIANTSLAVVERIAALVGKGSICSQTPDQNNRRKQTIYRWNLRTTECRDFVQELYPHLVAKRQQARILCGCPPSGERAEAAHAALIALHRTGESGVDFPEPPSMFSPGWYLRSDIIWSKCNPMPESVTDRPTKAHEYIFLLSKSARYYYDASAIKEIGVEAPRQKEGGAGESAVDRKLRGVDNCMGSDGTRNKRSVWHIATQPYPEAHFATFPEALIEPCILAGSRVGDTVLDPFNGSGTTGAVAIRHQRNYIGIELNADYIALARKRIGAVAPLFSEEVA
jgi:DNA modification methylase